MAQWLSENPIVFGALISSGFVLLSTLVNVASAQVIHWREQNFRREEWLKDRQVEDVERLLDGIAEQYTSLSTSIELYYEDAKYTKEVVITYLPHGVFEWKDMEELKPDAERLESVLERRWNENSNMYENSVLWEHSDKILNWFKYAKFLVPFESRENLLPLLQKLEKKFSDILLQKFQLTVNYRDNLRLSKNGVGISLDKLKATQSRYLNFENEYRKLLHERNLLAEEIMSFKSKVYRELNYKS